MARILNVDIGQTKSREIKDFEGQLADGLKVLQRIGYGYVNDRADAIFSLVRFDGDRNPTFEFAFESQGKLYRQGDVGKASRLKSTATKDRQGTLVQLATEHVRDVVLPLFVQHNRKLPDEIQVSYRVDGDHFKASYVYATEFGVARRSDEEAVSDWFNGLSEVRPVSLAPDTLL